MGLILVKFWQLVSNALSFYRSQKFLSRPKNLTAFSASSKLLWRCKNQFYWMQIIFLSGTKCLWLPQYVNKFLVWHKKFGPALNILEPVKGQGINTYYKIPSSCRTFIHRSRYLLQYLLFRARLRLSLNILFILASRFLKRSAIAPPINARWYFLKVS